MTWLLLDIKSDGLKDARWRRVLYAGWMAFLLAATTASAMWFSLLTVFLIMNNGSVGSAGSLIGASFVLPIETFACGLIGAIWAIPLGLLTGWAHWRAVSWYDTDQLLPRPAPEGALLAGPGSVPARPAPTCGGV